MNMKLQTTQKAALAAGSVTRRTSPIHVGVLVVVFFIAA
jgi:hypothetical protein